MTAAHAVRAVAGAIAFALAQGAWAVVHTQLGVRSAWMMKAGLGIGACFAIFLALGVVVSARHRGPGGLAGCVAPTALGAIASLVVALTIVGPGNLWPIVIVFDGGIIAAALLFGAALGFPLRNSDPA